MSNLPTRNQLEEARKAIKLWQAVEYLAPQPVPKLKDSECVWAYQDNDALNPWNDLGKQKIMKAKQWENWRFRIYAGIVEGAEYCRRARDYLKAAEIDYSESVPPKPSACVVLGIDRNQMLTGQVFVSSLPWAMDILKKAKDKTGELCFEGFYGATGFEKEVCEKILDLMVTRRLIKLLPEDGEIPDDIEENALEETQDELRKATREDIQAITDLVFEATEWRPKQELGWIVEGMRIPLPPKKEKEADDKLNSFFAEDLIRIEDNILKENLGPALSLYMQGKDSCPRVDVEEDIKIWEEKLHPKNMPLGCWPAKHKMVAAQQFAVNEINLRLGDKGGLFSTNGPPGTGKTTMLKDLVANNVVSRAEEMVKLKNPAMAFTESISIIDDDKYKAKGVMKSIAGFGMVVTSANNGAVENVTKELPSRKEISDEFEIDYFSAVSDSLAAPEKATLRTGPSTTWGTIAAALGNASNKSQFISRFRWAGITTNKLDDAKKNEKIRLVPNRFRSIIDLVIEGDHGALPWSDAVERFKRAHTVAAYFRDRAVEVVDLHTRFRILNGELEQQRQSLSDTNEDLQIALTKEAELVGSANGKTKRVTNLTNHLVALQEIATKAEQVLTMELACERFDYAKNQNDIEDANQEIRQLLQKLENTELDLVDHLLKKPWRITKMVWPGRYSRWELDRMRLEVEIKSANRGLEYQKTGLESFNGREAKHDSNTKELAELKVAHQSSIVIATGKGIDTSLPIDEIDRALQAERAELNEVGKKLTSAQADTKKLQAQLRTIEGKITVTTSELDKANKKIRELTGEAYNPKKWSLRQLKRDEFHRSSPFHDDELFEARRQLFLAAMEVNKSFVVSAWEPLKSLLDKLIKFLSGEISVDRITPGDVIKLWEGLFLIVPVVSTAFASLPRLFKGVGSEELPWVIIDEAGQAAPQQAVGALWRAKRCIVVGDPLQVEPVVTIPRELVKPLIDRVVAEDQWSPYASSAQILSDRANPLGSYLGEPNGEKIWVGSPLVVHRRCQEPMFSISNEIAYQKRMVFGSPAVVDDSPPTQWIHVPAKSSEAHWVPEQGEIVIARIKELTGGEFKHPDGKFKLYVISPFRTVADKMRSRLSRAFNLEWEEARKVCGTVHTFQGREADFVFFLLGGDPNNPGVIRTYAGAKPNIANVAATRAKRRLYVVGDKDYWTGRNDTNDIYTRMLNKIVEHNLV